MNIEQFFRDRAIEQFSVSPIDAFDQVGKEKIRKYFPDCATVIVFGKEIPKENYRLHNKIQSFVMIKIEKLLDDLAYELSDALTRNNNYAVPVVAYTPVVVENGKIKGLISIKHLASQAGIASTSYEVNGLSGNTTYYWRVNFTNAAGTSGWTSSGNFTTIKAAPSIPEPSLPANGATGTAVNPIISWNAVSGAASYTLQVSTVADCGSTVINQAGITTTSYTVTGLKNSATYYWRVNAVNADGASGWSTTGSFTTEAPASPTLKLWWPRSGATGVVINPSVTWSPESGALSYSLQVSADSAFATTLLHQQSITTNSFEVTGLSINTQYFWRVSVAKTSGICGWSQPAKFTVGNSAVNGATSSSSVNGSRTPHVLAIHACQNGAVQISLPFSGAYRLTMIMLSGQKAFDFTGNTGSAGFLSIPLYGANVPNGLYMMRLSVKGVTISKKMVVTK